MNRLQIGRYQIISELARGGMATVYLAQDPSANRQVGIKVLPRQFTHDPQFLARFQHEGETIASLEHRDIVPIYDFGQQDDQPYLVMRYMAGGTLSDRITQAEISLEESVEILRPIAAALDYAHARGVVHRDVKPGNILFDQRGSAYLSDFGIVRLTEATASFTGSAVIGTPAYMSPEQVEGGVEIDGRADVYALGIVLYEMLAGEVPYKGDTPTQQLMKHVLEPVPRISQVNPDLPRSVEAVLMRALAKDRDQRYPTAGAMVDALEGSLSAAPQPPIRESAPEPNAIFDTMLPLSGPPPTDSFEISYEPLSGPHRRRRPSGPVIAGLAALLVLFLGAGLLVAGWPLPGQASSTDTITPVMVAGESTAATVPPIDTEVPSTDTPTSTSTPLPPTPTGTTTPTFTPTPVPTSPSTATATPTPTATPNLVGTAAAETAVAQTAVAAVNPEIDISVDPPTIDEGQHTTLFWHIRPVSEVHLDGVGVVGAEGERVEHPATTTTYTWRIVKLNGDEVTRSQTVIVRPIGSALEHFLGFWVNGRVPETISFALMYLDIIQESDGTATFYPCRSVSPTSEGEAELAPATANASFTGYRMAAKEPFLVDSTTWTVTWTISVTRSDDKLDAIVEECGSFRGKTFCETEEFEMERQMRPAFFQCSSTPRVTGQ